MSFSKLNRDTTPSVRAQLVTLQDPNLKITFFDINRGCVLVGALNDKNVPVFVSATPAYITSNTVYTLPAGFGAALPLTVPLNETLDGQGLCLFLNVFNGFWDTLTSMTVVLSAVSDLGALTPLGSWILTPPALGSGEYTQLYINGFNQVGTSPNFEQQLLLQVVSVGGITAAETFDFDITVIQNIFTIN